MQHFQFCLTEFCGDSEFSDVAHSQRYLVLEKHHMSVFGRFQTLLLVHVTTGNSWSIKHKASHKAQKVFIDILILEKSECYVCCS